MSLTKQLLKMTLFIILATTINSCGDDSDSDSKSDKKEWTSDEVRDVRGGCYLDLQRDENYLGTASQASTYCSCITEVMLNKWGFEDYVRNELKYTDQLIEEGALKKCVEYAEITRDDYKQD